MAGNGLQGSLLGVRAESEGFGLAVTGIVMTGYFAGFLAGSRVATSFVSSVGHIRVFAALASLASATVLAHALWIHPVMWALMRFVSGLCMAGLYVVAESWLNEIATNASRARVLAVYMVAMMGGLSVGQLLLNAADPGGYRLFALASILVSIALVPMALSAAANPPVVTLQRLSIRELAGIVPTGVVSSFLVGASHGALMGMGAVYAAAVGLPASRISVFLAAPMVGAVVFQWPIGWCADRLPRRLVIVVVAATAAATATVLGIVAPDSLVAVVAMFVLGGTTFPLYSLAIAYTNDWLPSARYAPASAALVRTNGIGAVVGPVTAAAAMRLIDPGAFFAVLVVTHGLIVVYVVWRILFREAPPEESRVRVLPFPARASAAAVGLLRRRLGNGARLNRGVRA